MCLILFIIQIQWFNLTSISVRLVHIQIATLTNCNLVQLVFCILIFYIHTKDTTYVARYILCVLSTKAFGDIQALSQGQYMYGMWLLWITVLWRWLKTLGIIRMLIDNV